MKSGEFMYRHQGFWVTGIILVLLVTMQFIDANAEKSQVKITTTDAGSVRNLALLAFMDVKDKAQAKFNIAITGAGSANNIGLLALTDSKPARTQMPNISIVGAGSVRNMSMSMPPR